jgi:hypothetical protein
MFTKKTSRNQVTIPKSLIERLPPTDYFEAEVVGGTLVLRPVIVVPMIEIDRVRARLRRSRVGPDTVRRAVQWSRRKA